MCILTSPTPGNGRRAVVRTTDAFGGLSVLVNNAGIVSFGGVESCTLEQRARILDVNLTGVFNGIKAAVPALKTSGSASIINISSITGAGDESAFATGSSFVIDAGETAGLAHNTAPED